MSERRTVKACRDPASGLCCPAGKSCGDSCCGDACDYCIGDVCCGGITCNGSCCDGGPCYEPLCVCQNPPDCTVMACELRFRCDDNDPCTIDSCNVGECGTITCENELVVDDCVDLIFDGLCPALEETPGGFIALNDDDDNENDTPDKDDIGATVGENDLKQLTIWADGSMVGILELNATYWGETIRIWQNPDRTGPVSLPVQWALVGAPKTFFPTLYVEGISASTAVRDTTLILTFTGDDGSTCEDRVKLTVFSVTPTEVDATNPTQAKVTYEIAPPNLVLDEASFTAPGTSEQDSSLSTGFSFSFDQADVIGSGGTITLSATTGEATYASEFSVTRTEVVSPSKGTIGEVAVFGVWIEDGLFTFLVNHEIYARFAFICYAIDTRPDSKTLWFGFGKTNIATVESPELPTMIAGWTERLTVSDDDGEIANGIMIDAIGPTIPAQGPYFRSKNLSLDGWSVPNNRITAVGRIEQIIFTNQIGSGNLYFPDLIFSFNYEVDIVLEDHGQVPTTCP